MSDLKISGKIKVINPAIQVSSTFKKREFVVSTDEQHVQHILLSLAQDKCDILDKYNVGDPVDVSFNCRGNEWVNPQGETKYFTSLQAWRIEKLSEAPTETHAAELYNEIDDSYPLPF